MDKNVFINVAAPTLVSASGAPFIAITSKGTTDSFTEKLINKKRPDGTSLINHIVFDLECLQCKRRKKDSTKKASEEESCKHMRGDLPWWHSSKRHEEIEMMMAGLNRIN
jgi:pyruvate/2-oxoacid:ferredoxin oxidoreductase beta subunit